MTMKAKNLIYCCQGIESVFDSQVLELVTSLSGKKVFERVVLFLGLRNENEEKMYKSREIPEEIPVVTYKAYPNYSIFNRLVRRSILKALLDNKHLLDESIFHVREEILAWHLAGILKTKYPYRILADIRGANIEEIRENRDINVLRKYLKLWNYKKAAENLTHFETISAVSGALKNHICRTFNISPDRIKVTPDLAGKHFSYDEALREKMRCELNLGPDDTMVLFSDGGSLKWQNWQDSKIPAALAEKGIKILNLSKYPIRNKNVINKFVQYKDVPAYLNAADAALIWSNRRIVTEVRSPVKFSEYICCGLPVVANNSVDMISEYLRKTSFGLLLEDIGEADEKKFNQLRSISRSEISEYARRWLGIESITNAYLNLYSTL